MEKIDQIELALFITALGANIIGGYEVVPLLVISGLALYNLNKLLDII
tara:strand:- start:8018 stop:8161 length:144 start_codon:yes stop_codon:yes gene_type:complete